MTAISSRKQTKKDHVNVTLLASGWTLDSGLYKYIVSDNKIIDNCLVVHSYDNANYNVIVSAELLQTTTAVGSITFWAVNQPSANINIKYTIV